MIKLIRSRNDESVSIDQKRKPAANIITHIACNLQDPYMSLYTDLISLVVNSVSKVSNELHQKKNKILPCFRALLVC